MITITRGSDARNTSHKLFTGNFPVEELITRSARAHSTIGHLTPPSGAYPDLTGVGVGESGLPTSSLILNYAGIIAEMGDIAAKYSQARYEGIGLSYGNFVIPALLVNENADNLIVIDWPHGNEIMNARAVFDFIRLMLEGKQSQTLRDARENLGFLIIGHNPDGMVRSGGDPDGDGRNNDNPVVNNGTTGINLGRNYPNYWDINPDADKGSTHLSEPEAKAITAWLQVNNRVQRVVLHLSMHGWESQPDEGFLVSYHAHDPRNIKVIRSIYLFAKHQIDDRDYSSYSLNHKMTFDTLVNGPFALGDTITESISGYTATVTDQILTGTSTTIGTLYIRAPENNFTSGRTVTSGAKSAVLTSANSQRVPRVKHRTSKFKPYLDKWSLNNTLKAAAGILFEYSEQESSFGFTNTVTLDFLHGAVAGVLESIATEETGYLVTPAYRQPLNNNSDLADWHSTQDRPQWFRVSGVVTTHYPSGIVGDSTPFVEVARPIDSAWPEPKARAGYVDVYKGTLAYDAQTGNFTVGKFITQATTNATAYILADDDQGTEGTLTLMMIRGIFDDDKVITDGVGGSATTNGTVIPDTSNHFYAYGGRKSSGYLSSGHKENHINTQTSTVLQGAITSGSALTTPVQYGAMAFDGTYLYFVGGFDGVNYHAEIYRVPISDESQVPVAGTGWGASPWHTLTTNAPFDYTLGIQRHTCEVWHDTTSGNSYLLIVGGRNSVGYTNQVLLVRIDTKAESILGVTTANRGYHTSWLVNDRDELYVAGGYNGSAVVRTVYRIDLQTPAVVTTTEIPQDRRRQGIGVDWTTSIAYLVGGEQDDSSSPPDVRGDIYAYDFSTSGSETVTTLDPEFDNTGIDEHGDPIVVTEPAIMNPAVWVHRGEYEETEDQCLFIVGGEKSDGTFVDEVKEYDIGSNVMYQRGTNNTRWLYLKISVKVSGAPGAQVTLVCTTRTRFPKDDTRNGMFVRPTVITNPLNAIQRIIRHMYTIGPRIGNPVGWTTLSMPVRYQASASPIVSADETESRDYFRGYGDRTHADLCCIQRVSAAYCVAPLPMTAKINYDAKATDYTVGAIATGGTSTCFGTIDSIADNGDGTGTLTLSEITIPSGGTPFIDDETLTDDSGGSATADGVANAKLADSLTEVFTKSINTAASGMRRADIVFSPCFGSQMEITSTLFNFTLTGGLDITNLSLQWIATENLTADEQVTPTSYAQEPNGKFVLNWTDSGGADSEDVFDGIELNWTRTVTTWMRDVVHLRLESFNGSITVKLWFYGKSYSKTLSGTGEITGYTVDASQANTGGAIYSETAESQFKFPPSPSWFKRTGLEKEAWRAA